MIDVGSFFSLCAVGPSINRKRRIGSFAGRYSYHIPRSVIDQFQTINVRIFFFHIKQGIGRLKNIAITIRLDAASYINTFSVYEYIFTEEMIT